MRTLAVVALAVLCASAFAHEIEEDEGVLVLTDDNFDEALTLHETLLVEFYAPWCGHCKKLAPEYVKAAAALKKDGYRIAKMDATAHTEVPSRFEVQGFPTLKFFRSGKAAEYGGGRTESEIVNWVRKKSGPAAKAIATVEEAEAFKDSAEVAVIGIFASEKGAEAKAFLGTAAEIDDVPFAITTSADIASNYGLTAPAVVLFKDFDEGRADFKGAWTTEAISGFVNGNSLPLVVAFSQKTANKIFGGPVKEHLLVFSEEDAKGHDAVITATKAIAKDVKGRLLTVTVGKGNDRVLQYFGVEKAHMPTAAIVNMKDGAMKKYLLGHNKVTSEALTTFTGDYEAGKLKPHLKSEEVPATNDGPVKVVVGKSFADIALDEGKDVLLEFYAPWCGHCKSLAPIYEQLAERFAKVDSVVIAKIDATANEVDHPKVNVRGFPTLLFFPGGKKDAVVEFDGSRDLAGMTKFLQEHATKKFTLPDEDQENDEL